MTWDQVNGFEKLVTTARRAASDGVEIGGSVSRYNLDGSNDWLKFISDSNYFIFVAILKVVTDLLPSHVSTAGLGP